MDASGQTTKLHDTFDPTGTHTLQVLAKANRFNKWMYSMFSKQLKGEVLEIGSGIGNISKLAIDDNLSITLSDYNAEYCNWLTIHFTSSPNVQEVLQIDLLRPGFETEYGRLKEKFDSIFLLNVIEHIEDDAKALVNCRFMLKPGGHLIILAPAYRWLYCKFDKELGHYRRYTTGGMSTLLQKNGMTVIEKKYFNFLGIAGWMLFGKILKRKLIGQSEMSVFDSLIIFAKLADRILFNKIGLSIIITAQKP